MVAWETPKCSAKSAFLTSPFNLAKSEPYRSIFLTKEGKKLAQIAKEKHEIVYNFLIKIGVSKKNAQYDS